MKIIINRVFHIALLLITFGVLEFLLVGKFDKETTFYIFMTIPIAIKILFGMFRLPGRGFDNNRNSYLGGYLDRLPFGLHKLFLDERTVDDYYVAETNLIKEGKMEKHTREFRIMEKLNKMSPWMIAAVLVMLINVVSYGVETNNRILEDYQQKDYMRNFNNPDAPKENI